MAHEATGATGSGNASAVASNGLVRVSGGGVLWQDGVMLVNTQPTIQNEHGNQTRVKLTH